MGSKIKGAFYAVCFVLLYRQIFEPFFSNSKSASESNASTTKSEPVDNLRKRDYGDHESSSSKPKLKLIPNQCDSPSRGHFEKIYETGVWGKKTRNASDFYGDAKWPPKEARQKSASGTGSNLGYNTETSLKIIKDTIAKFNVKSMIDIPCGDVNWILDSLETDTLPLYVGLDITSAVIDINKQRFAHHTNKHFRFWDATSCVLPRFQNGTSELQSFDLVHIRDVIQHMHLDQGVKFFCNAFKSGVKVLIATTYNSRNHDIKEGDFYHNNLAEEPFSFPKSDSCTPTHPKHEPDDTCIYDLSEPWVQDFISAKCS
uniref:Methyltransferase domain-containing protein n=1 Tax=Attheya septentrionalis TaxID=420275 RepID=A0A7S2UBF9_9STRA|mmetsp:Transcript_17845/g.32305  ORF Transcript_17845/g.32305 Transcript_17845/m.32305 type:complete len:315 (+) Transcript_17845:60-1004(+)|eukprot:CAMPEP_0198301338 /NCGR_PEP_ID=MMETSP1449-20131203/51183_1 /TAXON_ID=420275 /ORGANISM="Attheya septentrionalis, Strain CCMP2084" /LENGTH=314 /DNA_ID=CAMNT_0044003389 /DNA_START=68 /DNA_END=1012 /DNA_ORIENTATION=-